MAKISDTPSQGKITFDLLHKYIGRLVGDNAAFAHGSMKLAIQESLEMMGTQIVASWNELGNKLADDHYVCTFYAPATAWDMFKRDHMPKWFKRKFPVKNKAHKRTVRFTRYAVYPLANIAVPKDNHQLFIQHLGGLERIEDKVEEIR